MEIRRGGWRWEGEVIERQRVDGMHMGTGENGKGMGEGWKWDGGGVEMGRVWGRGGDWKGVEEG